MAALVIFDLDGVLVDSETLAVAVEQRILGQMGWSLSREEIAERFVGRSAHYMRAEVERHVGRPVNWAREFDPHYVAAFRSELRAVDGAHEVLAGLGRAVCVASSSSLEQIQLKLELTGLLDFFAGALFSGEQVAHPKPAPDVFLHAARAMGYAPRECVVVEDSVVGVRAGLAAGMRVLGLASELVPRVALEDLGVEVLAQLSELPGALRVTPPANAT